VEERVLGDEEPVLDSAGAVGVEVPGGADEDGVAVGVGEGVGDVVCAAADTANINRQNPPNRGRTLGFLMATDS
jgi:hypothetical protein